MIRVHLHNYASVSPNTFFSFKWWTQGKKTPKREPILKRKKKFDPESSGTVEQDWYEIQIWIGPIPICNSKSNWGSAIAGKNAENVLIGVCIRRWIAANYCAVWVLLTSSRTSLLALFILLRNCVTSHWKRFHQHILCNWCWRWNIVDLSAFSDCFWRLIQSLS